jgi:hypothetical protein
METKDSVFVYMGKDTMFVQRFKFVYKDRIRQMQDTLVIYKEKTTVEKQTEKPGNWHNFMNKSGLMFWLFVLIGVILFVLRKRF